MSKYYTPEIEEFYIGFEYEQYSDFDKTKDLDWHKITFDGTEFDNELTFFPLSDKNYFSEVIRVKYLDREDIDECGWNNAHGDDQMTFYNYNNYVLAFEEELHKIMIWEDTGWCGKSNVLFKGKISNKSELLHVMKIIGIEN